MTRAVLSLLLPAIFVDADAREFGTHASPDQCGEKVPAKNIRFHADPFSFFGADNPARDELP